MAWEWQKVYTALRNSPKWVGLSPGARGVWIDCLLWVGATESDGFVPRRIAEHSAGNCTDFLQELAESDLWEVTRDTRDGFVFHDYCDAQAALLRSRELSAARQHRRRSLASKGISGVTRDTRARNARPSLSISGLTQQKGVEKAAKIEAFVEAWNTHCGSLPKLRKPPTKGELPPLAVQAVDHFDGDVAALAAAICQAAADEHYQRMRYGAAAFCRHLDRWDGAASTAAPTRSYEAIRAAERRREAEQLVRDARRPGTLGSGWSLDALLVAHPEINAELVAAWGAAEGVPA